MSIRLPSELPRMGGRAVWLSFTAIVAMFVLASAAAIYWTGVSQAKSREIVERMLASVELVTRLAADVDRTRILTDTHIFLKEPADMRRLEQHIARVEADFAATARAYAPFATENGEKVIWQDLQAQAAALEQPMRQALELSRQNRDREAVAVMRDLEVEFDAITRDAGALVRINHAEANEALATVHQLQQSSLLFAGVVTLVGIALSAVVAALLARLIRRRERELRASTAALEQRNRELDAFAGRVAHDLRGPLTTINLAASRLAERAPQEEGTSAVLRRGVTRMETLIRDLLTLSRSGTEAQDASSDPATVASVVAEEIGPRVLAAGGTLRVAVQSAGVLCSEGLLRQLLWNLVDNALKYRRPESGPEIEVRGHPVGSLYELRVSDRGMGMSADDASQVFTPFFRAVEVRDTPGTGLGLSIVKRVVEAHRGSISVESRLGVGTTFNVSLVMAPRPARASRKEEARAVPPGDAPKPSSLADRLRAWRARLRRA